MVARALAEKTTTAPPTTTTDAATPAAKPEEHIEEQWQAITLKCIPFSSHKSSSTVASKKSSDQPNPLYITVALMEDENRDQRCFHCILTDDPGTEGKLGSVTPELFAMLFTPRGAKKKKKAVEVMAK